MHSSCSLIWRATPLPYLPSLSFIKSLHCFIATPVMGAIPCLVATSFAHIQVVGMITLQPFLVDHIILSCHITPSPLLVKSGCHILTGLLVTFSLLCRCQLKAFLMCSAVLLLRMSLPCPLRWILSLPVAGLQGGSQCHRTQNPVTGISCTTVIDLCYHCSSPHKLSSHCQVEGHYPGLSALNYCPQCSAVTSGTVRF